MISRVLAVTLFVSILHDVHAQQTESVALNKVKLSFALDGGGMPTYELSFSGKPVIKPSHMGFKLDKDSVFYKDLLWIGSEKRSVDERWQPVWGEVSHIRDHYEQLMVHLQEKGGAHHRHGSRPLLWQALRPHRHHLYPGLLEAPRRDRGDGRPH